MKIDSAIKEFYEKYDRDAIESIEKIKIVWPFAVSINNHHRPLVLRSRVKLENIIDHKQLNWSLSLYLY